MNRNSPDWPPPDPDVKDFMDEIVDTMKPLCARRAGYDEAIPVFAKMATDMLIDEIRSPQMISGFTMIVDGTWNKDRFYPTTFKMVANFAGKHFDIGYFD